MIYKIKNSSFAVTASCREEAMTKIIALSKMQRNYIDNIIFETGFQIKEFDVGDSKTVLIESRALEQDYAKVLIVYEGTDAFRIGLDLPDLKDPFSSKVFLSKKQYDEQGLILQLKELSKNMQKAEKEYVKIMKEYRLKLKAMIG
jgi:hypothetical protein